MLPTMGFPRTASENLIFVQHNIQVYKRFQYKVKKSLLRDWRIIWKFVKRNWFGYAI